VIFSTKIAGYLTIAGSKAAIDHRYCSAKEAFHDRAPETCLIVYFTNSTNTMGIFAPNLLEFLNMRLQYFILILSWCIFATSSQSQTTQTSTTDPAQIAQECGGDAGAGEIHFVENQCATCHSLVPENKLRSGPHLQELFTRNIASADGFAYSPKLVSLASEHTNWSRELLHAFLKEPHGKDGGFAGFSDEQVMRDVMTYMRTETLPPPPRRGTIEVPLEIASLKGDAEYGEYLAGECSACHDSRTQNSGLPSIDGMPYEIFVIAMLEYKLRARQNAEMQLVAQSLGNEEIAALAAYFRGVSD